GGGRIAGEVARIAGRGFGMKLLVYDPYASAAQAAAMGAEKIGSLDAMLARADIVSIHVPLTAETRNLIGAGELKAMKRSAVLINIARGGVLDEAALLAALREGAIAGAVLDVFAQEPLPGDHPLWKTPNVLLTPHVSGISTHYDRRAVALFVENLRRYVAGSELLNVFDRARGY
ncbi:MAG: D-2-hydroxyacid dehydrogenase, partial [Chloroflexi bacterium]|nr:D-2-hydroxyacid dehydrogenase [Chloroflexota bacterium]